MMDTEFITFIRGCILHEQTEVVNFLISNEKYIDLTECMYNMELLTLDLPEGEKVMASTVFYRKLDNAEPDYDETLARSRQKGESEARNIYFWLLVPYWLGEKLIDLGEPVFRQYGCSWWGSSHPQLLGWLDNQPLQEIYHDNFA